MAIGYRAAGALGTSTTTSITGHGLPAGLAAGDLMVLVVSSKADALPTLTPPAGWTEPADNTITGGAGTQGATSGGVNRVTMLYREWQSGDAEPTLTISANASPSLARIVAFTKAVDETWVPPVCANAADTTGVATAYDPPAASQVLVLRAGDWLGVVDAINDEALAGSWSPPFVLTVAGMTLGTVVNRVNDESTIGNDSRLIIETVPVTSGTASAGPNRLCTPDEDAITNMAGCSVFWRLRAMNILPPYRRRVIRLQA